MRLVNCFWARVFSFSCVFAVMMSVVSSAYVYTVPSVTLLMMSFM